MITILSASDGVNISVTPVDELTIKQEEPDTKIIFHMLFAARHHGKPTVVQFQLGPMYSCYSYGMLTGLT